MLNTELKSYYLKIIDLMTTANATDSILDSKVISCKEYLDEFISLSRQ